MSIKLKLLILFLAVALIPTLLVTALTFKNYQHYLESDRVSDLTTIAAYKADKIETYFAGLKADMQMVQISYLVKKYLPVLTRYADRPTHPEFLAAQKLFDGLFQKIPSSLGLSDIMLFRLDGKRLYSSQPKGQPEHFGDASLEIQQKTLREGKNKIYFSDIFLDKTENGRAVMLMAGPAYDLNDAPIGVIVTEVDMAPVYKLVQDVTGLGYSGETLLGERDGNQVVFLNPLRHDPNAAMKRRIIIGDKIGRAIQEAAQGKNGSGQYFDYRGTKVVSAWRYLPSLGWGMVAKMDIQEAFADITNLKNLIIMIFLMIFVLSAVVAVSFAQSISIPIDKLSKGAEIVGRGNLDHKVGMNLKDEIGTLSRTFDKMTQDLKRITSSRDELNREVAERKRAEESLRQFANRQALLSESASLLLETNDPQKMIQQICRKTMEFLDCQVFFNFLFVKEKNKLQLNAYAGIPDAEAEKIKWLDYGAAICGCVARDGKGIIAEDILNTQDPRADLVRSYGVRAYCCNPLLAADKTIGTLSFGTTNRDRFSPDELLVMKVTADMVSVAMHRKQLEEKMESLASIVENSNDAITGKDLEGTVLSWNQGAEDVYGYKAEEIIGKSMVMLVPSGHEDEIPSLLKKVGLGEKIEHYETVRVRKDGRHIDVSLTISPIKDSNGTIIGASTIARDITERKKMEEELKRSNENLEQFAYVASHDLQEPLRMMASYSELLGRRYQKKLDADADEFIGYIVDGAKRMQKLINDLLAYSRVGRNEKAVEEIDCHSLLGRVLATMAPTIQNADATVTYDPLPTVMGHESHYIQLFQNLIGNAIKFHGEEPPRVHIRASKNGKGWIFSVKDNGIGIEPQYQDRIFLIFQRLHGRDQYPGTGIGLSICKKIVETQGGRMWVESEPGRGATFYFTVPAS